jgi:Alpha-L-arabinofuranosidase B (ABFB) domain
MPEYPTISVQSYSYPDRYIRHRHCRGELSVIESKQDMNDATFAHVDPTKNPSVGDGIVFQAANLPSFFLRHQDFVMTLQARNLGASIDPDRPPSYLTPEAELFNADTSFRVVAGLADPEWVSFRSANHPDRYIRHRGFKLYLERPIDDVAKTDSTFRIIDGFVPGPPLPSLR